MPRAFHTPPVRRLTISTAALLTLLALSSPAQPPNAFHFAILGDRTGEAQPGVYEQAWRELSSEKPAFVVSVGDTIQGLNDATADSEWSEALKLLKPFDRFPLYLAPGNHDIWSPQSEALFEKYATHPAHYSFDYLQAHFTILDNSRSDELAPQELSFLEADLKAHAAQPLKIIVSHRPSWLLNVAMRNPNFALHQLALKYGVQYVIAGHIHQMLHLELDGVTYVSMVSSGGHLRLSQAYDQGWFFGYALVDMRGKSVDFKVKELSRPHGEGRVTKLTDWGMTGLIEKDRKEAAPAK